MLKTWDMVLSQKLQNNGCEVVAITGGEEDYFYIGLSEHKKILEKVKKFFSRWPEIVVSDKKIADGWTGSPLSRKSRDRLNLFIYFPNVHYFKNIRKKTIEIMYGRNDKVEIVDRVFDSRKRKAEAYKIVVGF